MRQSTKLTRRQKIEADIANERHQQDMEFGAVPRGLSFGTWHLVLSEEVGEVAQAILQGQGIPEIRGELVQVAAVAVAFIEELDHLTQ